MEEAENMIHYWSLRSKYTDKKKKKKIPAKAKVYFKEPHFFRMDLYDPFGFIHVGHLVINNNFMKADFPSAKYEGTLNDDILRKILKIDVGLEDLYSVFTQKGFQDKIWQCAADEEGVLRECLNDKDDVKILWSDRMTQEGTDLKIEHPKANLEFKVKNYQKVQGDLEKIFAI